MANSTARLRAVEIAPRDGNLAEHKQPPAVHTAIAGLRPPPALQVALRQLETAQAVAAEARAEQLHWIASYQENSAGSLETSADDVRQATAAVEASQTTVALQRAKVRQEVEAWRPTIQRALAPHRAQAAERIVAAVAEVELAMAELRSCDEFSIRWSIEPHPRLLTQNLATLAASARKIAQAGG